MQDPMKGAITTPCAACKLLRRRCTKECIFAPFFPPEEPHKFACVHRVFGASNVSKMLQELPLHRRADAVTSMVYEARSRLVDPVYGCVGIISSLQTQNAHLHTQLALAQAEIMSLQFKAQTISASNLPQRTANANVEATSSVDSDARPLQFFPSDHNENVWT